MGVIHKTYEGKAWPLKIVFGVLETNEGTWVPDITIEIYIFGILVLRKRFVF